MGGNLADKVLKRYGGQGDDSLRHSINASMLPRVNVLVVIALIFIFPTLLMQEAVFFISFLFIGWTLLCESYFKFQSMVCLVHSLSSMLTLFVSFQPFSHDANGSKSRCDARG